MKATINQEVKQNADSEHFALQEKSTSRSKVQVQNESSQEQSSLQIKPDFPSYTSENSFNEHDISNYQNVLPALDESQHNNLQSQLHNLSNSTSFTKEISIISRLNWQRLPETIKLKQKCEALKLENQLLSQKYQESILLQEQNQALKAQKKNFLKIIQDLTVEKQKEKGSFMGQSSHAIDSDLEITKPKTNEQIKRQERKYKIAYQQLRIKYEKLRSISGKISNREIIPQNSNK